MRRRVLSAFVLSLVFISALSLSACGSLNNNKDSNSIDNISSSTVNVSNSTSTLLNVTLNAESVIENGKAKFEITTNLPDGTILVVSLSGGISNYRSQQNVTVKDGKTETSLFSNNNQHLDYGTYSVVISTPLDISVQPASVQSVFGSKGANLTGDYVLKDPVRVDYYQTLVINEYTAGVSIPSSSPSQNSPSQSSSTVPTQKQPEKIVDSNGKTIWKVYWSNPYIHFSSTYKGSGNFIIEVLDSNQDLYSVVVNEIGNYVLDKTVDAPPLDDKGYFYIEQQITDGSTTGNWQCVNTK